MWGTLIGLLDGGTPVLGLMDQPFTRERYWSAGDRFLPAHRPTAARQRMQHAACPRLADAILSTTHPDLFDGRGRNGRLRRGSSRRCA